MPRLTPRQRRAVVAPALGIALAGAGAVAWLATSAPAAGLALILPGLAAIFWGIAAQQRDPALRWREQPPVRGGGDGR